MKPSKIQYIPQPKYLQKHLKFTLVAPCLNLDSLHPQSSFSPLSLLGDKVPLLFKGFQIEDALFQ